MSGPNDRDPPDYVTGEGPMEGLFEKIYDKFPWVEDIDDMLADDMTTWSTPEGVANETINDVIEFTANKAYEQGAQDAGNDAGEYIHTLEMKAAIVPNAEQVLDRIKLCSGVCLDGDEWEYRYVARSICKLFKVDFPQEWYYDETGEQKR